MPGKKRNAPRTRAPQRITAPRFSRRNTLPWAVAGVALVALATMVVLRGPGASRLIRRPTAATASSAQFVGSDRCQSCHLPETQQWERSHHRAAMADATEQTVLGNFGDATIEYAGTKSRFFKRDGEFFVRTDSSDGRLADFQIRYTFGVYPLQQYLVALANGRVQALSIAWDSRPRAEGGQKWFHLYPGERVTSTDELHWTRPSQNWNYMCADCHSTGVRKNYDASADAFRTQWSEISVGCEACHGPGSRHLAWAANDRSARGDPAKGLSVALDERKDATWHVSGATGNATRSRQRTSDREIQMCAQCHSRRSQIAEGYDAGKRFYDYYRPALLAPPLYYADGQQRGEVYEWGSFLQSKMYARGVTCGDCHNPHSGELRAKDTKSVCASCHLPAKYDTVTHSRHASATGVTCVSCHMPSTTYMQVDARRDHSFRIPRPDVSDRLGTPNACTACHTERPARWAAAQITAWRGGDTTSHGLQRFADALAAAEGRVARAQPLLQGVATDSTQPAIARATALAELAAPTDRATLGVVGRGLSDPDPLVRLGALRPVWQFPPERRAVFVAPLLADTMRVIRIDAAGVHPGAALTTNADEKTAFEHAADEFIASQRYNADRADARTNLGTFFAVQQRDAATAGSELLAAIRIDPFFVPAYANLADVYRAQGGDRDADAERILRAGLVLAPRSAALHHALGLALVRRRQLPAAVAELQRAASLEPTNLRFTYTYAVALYSTGKVPAAIAALDRILAVDENYRDALAAMVGYLGTQGKLALAKRYSDRLRELASRDVSR